MAKKNLEKIVLESKGEVKNKKKSLKKILILTLLIVAIGGTSGAAYYYNKYQALKLNANIEAEKEVKKLVTTLDKLMDLPEETPTVATISDKEKLKDQSFFEKAENGDILFAYTNAMKAILYRPSTNKIINVAPITIDQTQDTDSGNTPEPSPEEPSPEEAPLE